MAGMRNFLKLSISDVGIFLLYVALMVSALVVIYNKHISRSLFAEQQKAQKLQDAAYVEWGQLLLEQGAWVAQQRIEKIARDELNMVAPKPGKIVVVKP